MRVVLIVSLAMGLAGCSGSEAPDVPDAENPGAGPAPPEGAAPDGGSDDAPFQPQTLFTERLEATGPDGMVERFFEVPAGATTLLLTSSKDDNLLVGRAQLILESPTGRERLVYGGHGIMGPANVFVGTDDEPARVEASPGTWRLELNTTGHAEFEVSVEAT